MGLLDAPTSIAGGLVDAVDNAIENPFRRLVNNTERAPDFPEGFQIFEFVNGQDPGNSPTVRMAGNMLPFIPFAFGGEQRLVKEYYPGNSEPAVHVLGSKETEVTIHGKFKDKRYKKANLYGTAYEMSKLLEEIRLRGNLLKITLGPWKRYAFLEKTDWKLNKLSEIEYSLQFFIVGFNKPANGKIVRKHKEIPLDVNKSLIDAATQFQTTYSTIPKTMPQSIGDLLNGAISDVAKAVNLVTNFVDTVITTAEDVDKAANRALGLIKNARTTISHFKRRIGALATDFASLAPKAKAATNFSGGIAGQQHLTSASSAATQLSQFLASLQKQFEALAKQTPLARYKVVKGDTLQHVALKYYNNADLWTKIYDHNKLTSPMLLPGQLLEIPRV